MGGHIMLTCNICGKVCNDLVSLSRHITAAHTETTSKIYYDTYFVDSNECEVCGNTANYISFVKGYSKTCSRSCGAKLHRHNLKNDDVKYSDFIRKVSENQRDIWEHRRELGTDVAIHAKASAKNRKAINQLSTSERKQRFGWMNKLTESEKLQWKQDIMHQTGMYLFWRTATDCEKRTVVEKRRRTMIDRGHSVPNELKSARDVYYSEVRKLTEKTYQIHKSQINPDDLPRSKHEYHLDHKMSIFDGFVNGVPPDIIASEYNLQMLRADVNNSKNSDSWISVDELEDLYNG